MPENPYEKPGWSRGKIVGSILAAQVWLLVLAIAILFGFTYSFIGSTAVGLFGYWLYSIRLRFSLRTILVVVTIAAVWAALIGYGLSPAEATALFLYFGLAIAARIIF